MNNTLFIVRNGQEMPVDNYKEFFPNLDFTLTGANCIVRIDASNIFDGTKINIACEKAVLTIGPGNDFHNLFLFMDIGKEEIVEIGAKNTFLSGKIFLRDDSCLKIGNENLFDFGLYILVVDGHTIFDLKSHDIINESPRTNNGIVMPLEIGNHNWIGENVFLTKKTVLKNDSVVGAASVVTRAFSKSNIAIAGNPARIVRESIGWNRLPIMFYRQHMPDIKSQPLTHAQEEDVPQEDKDDNNFPGEFDYKFFIEQIGRIDMSQTAARDYFYHHGGCRAFATALYANFTNSQNLSIQNLKIKEYLSWARGIVQEWKARIYIFLISGTANNLRPGRKAKDCQ